MTWVAQPRAQAGGSKARGRWPPEARSLRGATLDASVLVGHTTRSGHRCSSAAAVVLEPAVRALPAGADGVVGGLAVLAGHHDRLSGRRGRAVAGGGSYDVPWRAPSNQRQGAVVLRVSARGRSCCWSQPAVGCAAGASQRSPTEVLSCARDDPEEGPRERTGEYFDQIRCKSSPVRHADDSHPGCVTSSSSRASVAGQSAALSQPASRFQ